MTNPAHGRDDRPGACPAGGVHRPYAVEQDSRADGALTMWKCERCGAVIDGPVAEEAARRLAAARAARRMTWEPGDVQVDNDEEDATS